MICTFVNTIVFVSDLEKSKRFYSDTLNIKIKNDLETIVFFENQLVLHSTESILNTVFNKEYSYKKKPMGSNNMLLYFETDDLEALYNNLKDKVEMIHKIETQEWGQKVFRFYDPDRHIVEFGEPESFEKNTQ